MSINVEIENDNMVTGYVDGMEVIRIAKYQGLNNWSVGSSSCLPSDINKAKKYLSVMQSAFDEMAFLSYKTK